jgi:signal transduction histidine kinase
VRMVLLAMQAQEVADVAQASEATRQSAQALRSRIDDAAAELRTFVHSVMPPALVDRGLRDAIEDLVDRTPLPVRLRTSGIDEGLGPVVERTAYFVVAEALTNALKHARAAHLEVCVSRSDGRLTIEVADDGCGGADLKGGSGLRGLADRVDVLGGRLRVETRSGAGTRLTAELPCAS